MDKLLIKYWFQAEEGMGVGVTAYNLEDAISLIKLESIVEDFKPKLDTYIENINIQELDQNHVIPNMGVCSIRGVWFPNVGNTQI